MKSAWVLVEVGGAKALNKRIFPVLFHVGSNEIPAMISQLLARDINEFELLMAEIGGKAGAKKASRAPAPKSGRIREYKIGDKVRIVNVEHLTPEDRTTFPKWVRAMDKFSGAVTTVTGISRRANLLLAVDAGQYRWSPDWVSKAS